MKRIALVLALGLAACGSFARPITRPDIVDGLPPLPTQVPSQLGPIPIVIVDSLADEQGRPLMGGYHTMRRTIYLRREITSRRMQWYVLSHERCHIVFSDGGLDNLVPPQVVQAICDAFAANRVADMVASSR